MSSAQFPRTIIPHVVLFGAFGALVVGGLAWTYFLKPVIFVADSPSAPITGASASDQPPTSNVPEIPAAESMRRNLPNEITSLPANAPESEYRRVTDLLANCGDRDLLNSMLKLIPDRSLRENFLQRVAATLAQRDPAWTAAWLRDLDIDADRGRAFANLGREWAETAPGQASNFALHLPAGDLRRETLAATVAAWISKDPAGAIEWAGRLDAQPDFDPTVAEIARSPAFIEADLPMALSWAGSILNDNMRKQSVSIVVNAWAERDPSAARQYLQSCPVLPAFQRDSILEDLSL